MDIQLAEGEKTLKEGPANHFKGTESVGRQLCLTSLRLFFKSHSLNVQTHAESYSLGDIARVGPRNTLGIILNGMSIFLKDGREEKFVIFGREDWMRLINAARNRPAA
jgi:hypothetical protein